MLIVSLVFVQVLMVVGLIVIFRKILGKNVTSATHHLEQMNDEYTKKEADLSRRLQDADACAVHVRAAANLDSDEALAVCDRAVERHPLAVEVNYLHAVLLAAHGREDDALQAARRVVYLDSSLAVGHMALAMALQSRGDLDGACRSYGNAYGLCKVRPPQDVVEFSDGEEAGRLAEVARVQMETLRATSREAR